MFSCISIRCCHYIHIKKEKVILFIELSTKNTSVRHSKTFIKKQFPSFMSPYIHFIPQIPLNKNSKECLFHQSCNYDSV